MNYENFILHLSFRKKLKSFITQDLSLSLPHNPLNKLINLKLISLNSSPWKLQVHSLSGIQLTKHKITLWMPRAETGKLKCFKNHLRARAQSISIITFYRQKNMNALKTICGCLKLAEIHPIYAQILSIKNFWSKEIVTQLKRWQC